MEVEAIGKVKHKNLVSLLGYCAEGVRRYDSPFGLISRTNYRTSSSLISDHFDPSRLLVYEYIDNGNLEQWLHGDVGPVSPLTWDIRIKIAIGTARG